MKIKEHILEEITIDTNSIQHLTIKLDLTPEQVKNLLIRYAFDRLVVLDDVSTMYEVADLLKRKYMEK